jgi:putative ABC transport system permease protein
MSDLRLPPRVRRLFRLPWRSAARVVSDVDEELRFHLESRADELIATGVSPEQALAEAYRRFGDSDDVRRHALAVSIGSRRRTRVRELGVGLAQDFRFALRQIGRAPLFAGVAVLTLALGIGANSAIFSVVHHLVLSPLPYRDGNRIVQLMRTTGGGHILLATTQAQLDAWRVRARSLEEITTVDPTEYTLGSGAERERVVGAAMEPNLSHFLGVRALLGRSFTPNDVLTGAAPVVMLGYGIWRRRFGGRADAVGTTVVVDDTTRTIVGVAPPGLSVPMNAKEQVAIWTPLMQSSTGLFPFTFAKLRRGVTVDQAGRELTAIANTLPTKSRVSAGGESIRPMRPQDFLGDDFQRALLLLFGAVGIVLLIACANVANLLLVRSWGRQREFAVRTALGAGRARLARQLLTESTVLTVTGGAFGLLLAWCGLHVFRELRPLGLEELDGVRIEPAVLLWTAAIAVTTGIFFGLFPTLVALGRSSDRWLKTAARSVAGTRTARRMRSALIVGEIALSVILLVAAGLLVRSFRAMQQIELGFDPHKLASFSVAFPHDSPKKLWSPAFNELLARVRTLPGVDGASFASSAPPEMGVSTAEFQTESGGPLVPIKLAAFNAVGPDFFNLAHIRLRGRTFSSMTGGPAGGGEAVINEALARRLWPNDNALGHRLRAGPTAPWVTVVGVSGDIAAPGRNGDVFDLQLYVPSIAGDFPSATIVLRSDKSIDALAPTLRRIAAQVDSRLEIRRLQSSETEIAALLAAPRFAMTLVGALAFAALALCAVGLYGVIAYTVSQRTREIGVRVALGAEPRDIGLMVVRDGAILALAGLAIGLAGAVAAGRTIESFLYGVGRTDPLTYFAVAVMLGAVGLVASYVPARRAMHVDPIVALSAD